MLYYNMAGGLSQLVAYGAQDVYLTGDPKKTFWREKFSRYSNFAMESIQQDILGDIGPGQTISFTLKRNGDLVSSLFLEITLQRGPSGPTDPRPYYSCEQLIDYVEVYIGGQKVVNFGHEWFRMYWELCLNYTQAMAYASMANWRNEQEGYTRTFYLPIPLWFNALDVGKALPLIALQYHEVEVRLRICSDFENIVGINPDYTPQIKCYANYTFLDTTERVWFAKNPHEYLIHQIQTNNFNISVEPTSKDYNLSLNFNHPCSSLVWCFTPGPTYHGQYTSVPGEQDEEVLAALENACLLLNGQERFTTRKGSYFSDEGVWVGYDGNHTSAGVYTYAFGVHSGRPPPSGTCNFSRIDSSTLRIRTKAAVVANKDVPGDVNTDTMTMIASNILNQCIVFAPNYNVLRIMSGMGGLAYAS